MAIKIRKGRLRAFLTRQHETNAGLLLITLLSLFITAVCAIRGFRNLKMLVFISVCLVLICIIHFTRKRKGFRTLPRFKGRVRQNQQTEDDP